MFAFATRQPIPLIARIRTEAMPGLLHEDDEGRWLSCPFDDAVALAQPYPSQLMGVER